MSVLSSIRDWYNGAVRAVGFAVASSVDERDTIAPRISSGNGAPNHAAPDGSLYLRKNGAAGTTHYSRAAGAWTALATGAAPALGDDEILYFGADDDVGVEYDEDGTNDLRWSRAASQNMVFPDDMKLYLGGDKDVYVAYDEAGADTGVLGGTNGWRLLDSLPLYFGTDKDTTFQNDGSTGLQVLIADNDADSFEIAQSTNVYLTCDTRNDLEKVFVSKLFAQAVTGTVAAPADMAGATHTLVLTTAGAAQTKLVGNMLYVDANLTGGGSSAQNLVLPSAASCTGMLIAIKNVGGEQITVNTTVMTLEAGEGGFVISDGTAWAGFGVGANT